MTQQNERMSAADMRASAQQLRGVLEAINSGTLKASGRQSAFIAGALSAVEMQSGPAELRPIIQNRSGTPSGGT